jgi:zinc transporter 1/2/3
MGGDSAAVKTTSKIVELLPLNVWKCVFQLILTSINVVCWLVPLRAKNFAENKILLSLANAFSGGVFLSLAFAHLIPECVHGFGELESSHNEGEVGLGGGG